MAPSRRKELVPKDDLKILWTEKDMKLFKDEMDEVLQSQLNIRKSCMPKSTLRLCEKALKQLVYYHELCRSMNQNEFDSRCEQYDFHEDINKKLAEVEVEQKKRDELEAIVNDLEAQLIEAKKINVNKKELLQKRDEQLEQANEASKVKKDEYSVLMKEAAEAKDEEMKVIKASTDEVKVENTKMQRAIGQAEHSTKGLKNALEACGSVLKDAPAKDDEGEEAAEPSE